MKANKFILPLIGLVLISGCSAAVKTNAAYAKQVTAYLCLTKVGQASGYEVQEKIPTIFVENAIVFKGEVGAALPGKDAITATSGAAFKGWVAYDGAGAPTYYTTLPDADGKILYAYFANGTGGGGGGGSSSSQETSSQQEGNINVTIGVDCSKLLSWSPAASDFSIHAWNATGALAEWGSSAELMTAGSNGVYTYNISSPSALVGLIFHFKQDGATKQTVDIDASSLQDGDTAMIQYDDATWTDGKMAATLVSADL